MKELENEVVGAFRALVESGDLKKRISDSVQRTVEEALKDQLGPYSAFGKALREALASELRLEGNLGLGGYNAFVADVVRAKLRTAIEGQWREHLEAQMDQFLAAAPPVIKLSELVEGLVEEHKHEAESEDWHAPRVVVEKSQYGGWTVGIDPDPEVKGRGGAYSCRYILNVHEDGRVFSTHGEEAPPKRADCYKVQRAFFQFRAAGTKLEVDEYKAQAVTYPHCTCD
jgi:hypothetical protein